VGVVFAVEPHLGSIVPTPEKVLHLLEMTPGLSLTLDYTHFTYQGIKDSVVEPLVAFASHFHARCGAKSRPQVAFKDNEIDYGRVIEAMKKYNYSGYIELEYVWIDWEHCNEVDNLSETIQLRDFILQRIKDMGNDGLPSL
jgi:sugar phosphate isomerase/epimerase